MEGILSEESVDSDMKTMKDQLLEYGLGDENLCKEEMTHLLQALNDSKTSAKEQELVCQKGTKKAVEVSSPKQLKRRYLSVEDRRLPWCLLPNDITPAQKAHTLAVYIKLLAMNRYRHARQLTKFAAWSPPIQITDESTRIQPCRSTRSGRVVPMYTDYDDDSSDLDFVVSKTKRRKVSGTEVDVREGGGLYSNKVLSLKRKPLHDSIDKDYSKYEPSTSTSTKLVKRDIVTIDED